MPIWTTKRQRAYFKSIMEQPHYYAQLQIEMVCADKVEVILPMVTTWRYARDCFISPCGLKTFHF